MWPLSSFVSSKVVEFGAIWRLIEGVKISPVELKQGQFKFLLL